MAVTAGAGPALVKQFSGLSTDTKPAVNVNDMFFETDTGKWYVYSGTAWYQNGLYVAQDYRGQYPETWGLTWLGAIGTNAGDIIYTSSDISMYSIHEFQGVTAGVFTVEVSLDGTNFSGAVALEDGASPTPATRVAVSANLTSIYTVYGKFAALRVKQSGATGANARGRHAVR